MTHYQIFDKPDLLRTNDAYPKIYDGEELGNIIPGRARMIYILWKGEVHGTFFGIIYYFLRC